MRNKKYVVTQYRFSDLNDNNSALIAAHIEKVAKASATGIDLMFAQFIKETKLPISKIEMVQEQTPLGHKIYFRARRGRTRLPQA